jgi:hypothetical protein
MSAAGLEALRDGFYVHEAPEPGAPDILWLKPGSDVDLATTPVDVGVRPALLSATRIANLTLRQLTFRHAATPLQDAAVRLSDCANIELQDVRIEDNNWNGLSIHNGRDIRLRRVVANRNGAGGLGAWRVRGLVVEDVEASYNNWRGGWGGFHGWATGQKFFFLHDARFTRYLARANQAAGLWFDTDLTDVTVERSVLCENTTQGLFLEAVQGPFMLRDSIICDNGETGILATAAAGVTLERNVIRGNRDHQIHLPWSDPEHVVRRTPGYDGQTMDIRSTEWSVVDNVIAGQGGSLLLSVGNWPHFLRTLGSDFNRWDHDGRPDALAVYLGMHAQPSRLTLDEWRALTGQDRSSQWGAEPDSPGHAER